MHVAIVDALGNEIISNYYRVNSLKIRLIRQAQTRIDAALVVPVMDEHLAVIAVLRTRDPVRAAAAMAAHIERARNRALGVEG
jgi:DNA-binding GntR family transcriptional regulator